MTQTELYLRYDKNLEMFYSESKGVDQVHSDCTSESLLPYIKVTCLFMT